MRSCRLLMLLVPIGLVPACLLHACLLPAYVVLGLLECSAADAEDPLLAGGDFRTWRDGLPEGWVAGQGAQLGFVGPQSETNRFEPLQGGGIASVGRADTQRWMLLSRRFAAQPGATYRIDFEARGVDLEREGKQFANRWIGAFFKDARGQRLAFPFVEVHAQTFQPDFLHVRAPAGTAWGEAAFFCSLSGRFEVKRMALTKLAPEASFDVLVQDMDRHYPFFAQHGIDWQALAAKHGAAARAARTPAAFAEAITPMLAALEDGHVWIDVPGRARQSPHAPEVSLNFEVPQVIARLKSQRQVVRNVIAGRTHEGYGYLAIGSMEGTQAQFAQIDGAWQSLFDAPAIILDLRVNGGGQESWGQQLMGCLTPTPVPYGRSLLRAGRAHDSFRPGGERSIPPREAQYTAPVIALVGPGCVSSGEAMAMMGRALPNVTLVGLPTRGSSGNPAPVHLPNGVAVWYSRWISLLPDGTGFERKGIAPDVRAAHEAGKDAAFDKALALIKERLAR